MRNLVLYLLLLLSVGAMAQGNISVKSFRALPMDMTASSLEGKRVDQNGKVAALIKVVTSEKGFSFEGGALGIVDSQQRNGEIWVWVPYGLRKITILHQQLGVLRDWMFPEEIVSERTYEMVLTTARIETVVIEEAREQYLLFQVTPPDAVLEVDGQLWELDNEGKAMKFVSFGTFSYNVQAPNYHPDGGKVVVDDPKNTKIVTVNLKPNFGFIEVTGTDNLKGAAVYVDNAFVGKAPCKSEALKSGKHNVRIAKELYDTYNEAVTVNDNETTTLSPSLKANFAAITLTVDADAEIWVNDEKKGTRSWTGNLGSGTYKIECKQVCHETSLTTKEITPDMGGQTITLPKPKPIYGSLNVESSPLMAKVYIDGKEEGTTPKFISELLVGTHTLRLTKEGYTDYTDTVTIAKGERKQVTATLNKKAENTQPVATTTSASSEDQIFTVNGVSFTMKYVEGGTFQMGADNGRRTRTVVKKGLFGDKEVQEVYVDPNVKNFDADAADSEKPVHGVTLSNYYMGETEVTQALWQAVMGNNPSYIKGDNLPVEKVSWNDIQEFIRKLNQKTSKNFRLPTEAEWEYAARGGKKSRGYKFAGSNTKDNVAVPTGKGQIVKTKSPNELGLYDMSGNAMEFCQDWYGSDYYEKSLSVNPQGPSSGSIRVMRGGCWYYEQKDCRVSCRYGCHPNSKGGSLGFRLALP